MSINDDLKNYETIIKEYYNNHYRILLLKNNIENLRETKSRIEKDLRNNNIKLTSNLKSNAFITINKDITYSSPQEKAIEIAYLRLEEKVLTTLQNIYKYERLLIELETDTNNIKYIINSLNDINRKIIDYFYNEKLSIINIANKLYLSESTIRRQKRKALKEFGEKYELLS